VTSGFSKAIHIRIHYYFSPFSECWPVGSNGGLSAPFSWLPPWLNPLLMPLASSFFFADGMLVQCRTWPCHTSTITTEVGQMCFQWRS